jgi:hypothetical protein
MNNYEPVQGNTVSIDALEEMQTAVEGVSILLDSLIFTIVNTGVPTNIDSVRAVLTDQLDNVAKELQTISDAANGKRITICDRSE